MFHEQLLADGDALRSVAHQGQAGLVVKEKVRQALATVYGSGS